MKKKCWSAITAASFFLVTGCGFKADPVPPETVVPVAIDNLRYNIDANGVELQWSYPVKSIAGSKLENIDSFEIFLAEMATEDVCTSCPIPFGEPIELPAGTVLDEEKRAQAQYRLQSLTPSNTYFVSVRSRTSWWVASDDSNIISFTWFPPAKAPQGLAARAKDGEIELAWQPVYDLSNDNLAKYPIVYQVQRAEGDGNFRNLGSPTKSLSYTDRQVILGQKYSYRVQSLMEYKNQISQGLTSAVVTSQSVDQTAPPPPRKVRVAPLGSGVKIIWEKVSVPDLKGYRIYRHSSGKRNVLLAEVSKHRLTFDDPRGKDADFYVVTSIDESGNESSKSRAGSLQYH